MSCSCALIYEDCENVATIWRVSQIVSSRKAHYCCECGDPIPIGSRCCKAVSLYDGSWWTAYRCVSCAIYAEYISLGTGTCPLWGHLHDFIEDGEYNWDRQVGLELPTLHEWREHDRATHKEVPNDSW